MPTMGCEAAPETGQPHRSLAVLGSSYRDLAGLALNDLLIVPTLCVVTPLRTLRVLGDAERHGMHSHAEREERSVAAEREERSIAAHPLLRGAWGTISESGLDRRPHPNALKSSCSCGSGTEK